MCSVQDSEDLSPVIRRECVSRNCMKCSEPAVVVIRVNDALCRECFLSYCVHKFRMSFGKSKLIRDKEHVLLAFSGGSSSSGMLHLVQEGKSERAKKKLRFVPLLVHIDESAVVPAVSVEEEERIVARLKGTGLDYRVYRLEQVYDTTLGPIEENNTMKKEGGNSDPLNERLQAATLDPQGSQGLSAQGKGCSTCRQGEGTLPSARQTLQDLFSSAKSLSAKQALLLNLRLHLLARVAVEMGVNKVLLGDSGTRLAIRMLSDITQGRGAHLSFEMSFADKRRPDVTYVRPMREFTNKEITMYNVLNKVDSIFIPNFSTKAGSNSSIEELTEQFVTGLQADFPNTVSTVFRTGEKLDLSDKTQSTEGDSKCAMCQAPLDTDVPQCSALSATIFSQTICTPQSPPESGEGDTASGDLTQKAEGRGESEAVASCCGNGDGSCQTVKTRMSTEDLQSTLCYGCRLVVKDMKSHDHLPDYVLESAGKQIRRRNMKESIQDFLIDES